MRRLLPFLVILLVVALVTKTDHFFYLLYTLFGILVLGRLWARRSLAAVTLQRHYEPRIFFGETAQVRVEIANRSWLPVLWMRLHDTVPADLASSSGFRQVLSLSPRERLHLEYTVHGRRRGYYQLGPLVTLGGDLLGSASYENRQAAENPVIVYPRILPLSDLGLPSQSPFGTLPSRQRLFEDPTRIRGVRDYQPGDSLRRMDWKTSARVGSLQVRRYEPAIALETAIFLNLDGEDYAPRHRRQATELGITIAASVAVHLIGQRQAVALATNGHDPLAAPGVAALTLPLGKERAHLTHLLDLLARVQVDPDREAMPFLDLLSRKSLGLPWGSTALLITAREVPGLLDTLLALRRRGLVAILAMTCPHRGFERTARRAAQIGVTTLRLWAEKDLDVWR